MCTTIGKYYLYASNLFFVLSGVALVGLGVAIELPVTRVADLFDDLLLIQLAPILAIIAGCMLFIVALFGWCASFKESPWMLILFSMLMLVLIALKVALVTLIFVEEEDFLDQIPVLLLTEFVRDRTGFQVIERIFVCCGPLGSGSYLSIALPETCCTNPVCTPSNAYRGCNVVIENFFTNIGLATGIFASIVIAFEVLAVIFSSSLAYHLSKQNKQYYK
ncbi:unnamed protein product [Euphydryas editha]|uniref:Tetraspanin n=1 Tax=Euphydryas editha TaxID=104508 RepID=A0AAU9TTX4_EUPED|nr:unnamed protein product [Euphydryas editha]